MSGAARQGGGPRLLGEGEAALAALLAAFAVVVLAADATGALLGGGLASPKTALVVLAHALRGAPGLSWPPDHAVLSRPAYLLCFGSLAPALLGAGVTVVVVLARRRGGEAGFASHPELERAASVAAARRAAGVTRPSLEAKRAAPSDLGYPLGVVAGSRRRLVASWEHSLMVVAPPGAGKTTRVLAPILRQHPGPVLATSTKADLVELTLVARQRRGPVVALDPQGLVPGVEVLSWSPVAGCLDARVAERRAGALVAAAGDGADVRGGGFFRRSAAAVLAAYLHAAALEGASMRDVLAWAARPSDPAPLRALASSGEGPVDWAARLSAHTTGAEETTSGVMRTVDLALGCFADPAVLASCTPSAGQGLALQELLAKNATVFALGKDREGLGGAAPLVSAFCDELLVTAELAATTRPGRRLDPPLLACLDEAPSIAPLPGLPGLLADGRGRGITTLVAMQSLSQAQSRWGRQGAETMRNAASILLVFGGLSVAGDLEELSRLCGTRRVERVSTSGDGRGRESRSVQLVDEAVLSSAEVHGLEEGVALVLWGRLAPVLVRLPAVFEGKDAATLAEEEAVARAANDAARRAASRPGPGHRAASPPTIQDQHDQQKARHHDRDDEEAARP